MNGKLSDSAGNLIAVEKRNALPTLLVASDSSTALLTSILMMLGKIRQQLEQREN